VCNNVCSWWGFGDRCHYVGGICVVGGDSGINGKSELDALAMSSHVTHLSLVPFRKILGSIFYVDERPSAGFALSNCFQPCCFWGICR
jgi:hypothetical protein